MSKSTADNMQSVSSSAVAEALGTNYDDTNRVDISSRVTKYLGLSKVYAYRKSNKVYIYLEGQYTGSPNISTTNFVTGLPQKYRPKFEVNGVALLGYNTSQYVATARGSVDNTGSIKLQECAWNNGTSIRSCMIYFVD